MIPAASDEGSARSTSGYMRKKDAAKYMGVSERQLTVFMRRGTIPYAKLSHRVCLFKPLEIDRAILRMRAGSI